MNLRNRASIAHALVSLALCADDTADGLLAATVVRAPADDTHVTLVDTARAMGMETLVVYTPPIEFHPGAIDVVSEQVERAIATGRPVFVLLDGANGADRGVVRALGESILRRIEDQSVIVVAAVTHTGEERILAELGEGTRRTPSRFRTADENARLVAVVAEAVA